MIKVIDIQRKTRKQIIMEKRNELIYHLFENGGFLLEEIGEMFKIKQSRVSQILGRLAEENKKK